MSVNSSPPASAAFARALLAAAADVEADEQRIKQAILDAAARGDCAAVGSIVTRWISMPAAEVLCPQDANQPLIDVEQTR